MPGPQIDVVVTSAESGSPMRATTYRGLIDVSVDTNQGPTLTAGTVQWVLPDSRSYERELLTGASAACTVVPVGQTPIVADVRTLIDSAAASLADDPAGGGAALVLLSVALQTTNLLEAFTVRLSYEATTVVAHP